MHSDKEIRAALKKVGSVREVSRKLGIPRTTLRRRLKKMNTSPETFRDRKAVTALVMKNPRAGHTKRYIFSSAQDGTKVHEEFLTNLEAYAEHVGAEIHIGGFTYNKSLFEDHSNKAAVFHPRVEKYLTNSQMHISDKVMFCGEINTSPTATHPLSGFETYTRDRWGIFPHPRVSLKSVATMFSEPAKQIMTTGSVTLPNYIPKKAGVKAEFHHVIGAVIVEHCWDGSFFCRHIIAEKCGSFQDLDTYVENGSVMTGCVVEAITWGDVHFEQLDTEVYEVNWGSKESMIDGLMPSYQFFHDVLDFKARNHHNIGDPHHAFKVFLGGEESVEASIRNIAGFLRSTSRAFCHSVVVESNHDRMLMRWLKEADYKRDPVNAEFFLDAQRRVYKAIRERNENFILLEDLIKEYDDGTADVIFLREDDSFKICNKTIECAIHGHKGANGARGSLIAYSKMGPKANVGHTHSAAIYEGVYQAGTSSLLDMEYNRGGLSSWNHAHIVTYPNGKRAIVTIQNGKYRG